MPDEMTLSELAEASGVPARTIRFYIARGLVDGPLKAGRGATYSGEHLRRIEQIKKSQAEGRMLSEIGAELDAGTTAQRAVEPLPWLLYPIADDIVVLARAETGPWRTQQIREAVEELARRLAPQGKENDE